MEGIACAGNWIVDHIKFLDCWPDEGALANIGTSEYGVGGSPVNVLTDLAGLGFPHPTLGIGCVGGDEFGRRILAHCAARGVNTELVAVLADETTSYTDVMTPEHTGRRTFFHHRGANARFGLDHVSLDRLAEFAPRIFHLGYLLLLDAMDASDHEYGTVAARLLAAVRERGIRTSIDVVSEARDRWAIVAPSLRHTDHCIINEYEAQRITGIAVRLASGEIDRRGIAGAARALLAMGVSQTAIIHCPEGGYWCDAAGTELWVPAFDLPEESIVSPVGAGDAFCAGVLYGIHDGWSPDRCLTVANAAAAMSLRTRSATGGVETLEETLSFARSTGARSLL